MSLWNTAKKPFMKYFAIAVIGGSALSGCIEQAHKQHKQPVQVINQVEVPKAEKKKIDQLLKALNNGRFTHLEQIDLLRKQATQALRNVNDPDTEQFLKSIVVTANQIQKLDQKIQNVQGNLVELHHGHASDVYVQHQIINELQEFTASYAGGKSVLGATVNNVNILELAGLEFPYVRDQLIDLRKSVEIDSSIRQGLKNLEHGDAAFEAYNKTVKQLQGIISRHLDSLK